MLKKHVPLPCLIAIALVAPAVTAQEAHLFSPTVGSFSHLGTSVAVSGDTVVVGAVDERVGVYATGAAHVFVLAGGSWNRVQQLVGSGAGTPPVVEFGESVAIDGDTIVVGAPWDFLGAAYVFTRSGTVWSEQAQLISPGAQDFDGFGTAVAIEGDDVVVGAPFEDGAALDEGAAYVFTRSGTVWSSGVVLTPASTAGGVDFGAAVSIAGDRIVVGAPAPFPSPSLGSAHVFVRSGSTWSEEQRLVHTAGSASAEFGAAVSLRGATLAVGARLSQGAGVAVVYEREASTWSQTIELTPTAAGPAYFGSSVSLAENVLAVGAPISATSPGGAVHVFALRDGAWAAERVLDRIDGVPGDGLGRAVAIDGAFVIAGAPSDDVGVLGATAARGLAFDPAADRLLTVTIANELLAIEPFPGGTVLGNVGVGGIRGLAYDPVSSTLYGAQVATDELLTIDTGTGVPTVIGSLGFGAVRGLAFDPTTSTLYGSDVDTDMLISIDTSTGAGTAIGPMGFGTVRGLAFDPGTGTLYGVNSQSRRLLSIDTSTGAGTEIGGITFTAMDGLSFDTNSGKLFGTRGGTTCELIEIDPLTGAGTKVAPLFASSGGSGFVYLLDLTETYCTAGVSASGCQPTISTAGSASATATSGFDLTVSSVEGSKVGIFFFGANGRQASPWGSSSSYQCVVPPLTRAGLISGTGTTGLCDGTFTRDLNAFWCPSCPRPLKNPGAGELVQAQLWYRDPQSTSNQQTSLSGAIEFLVGG